MAQQRVTTFVDDLDDTVPAEETVTFARDKARADRAQWTTRNWRVGAAQ